MAYFDPEVERQILQLSDRIKPEDLAEPEREPHVTVLYGLHTRNLDDITKVLDQCGIKEIKLTLGKTSTFPPSEGSDGNEVVKIDIDSEDLHRINAELSKLDNSNSYPEYHPHITLGYVNSGVGEKYVGMSDLEGTEITTKKIVFSTPDSHRSVVFLS
jgi:2'-5' RNA ligase